MSSVILCFILSCRLRLLSPIRCVIFYILSYPLGIWSFILCVLSLIVVFPIQITFLYPMYRMLYIAMPTRYVLFYSMCLFQFDYFLHPMCHKLYVFILSRMCSFIVCFILSGPFVTLSHLLCVIYLMMSIPPECVPLPYVSYVLHCLLDCVPSLDMASAFYCHMLYIVISTCDVSFHAMVLGFYFILCSRITFPIRCVICFILACPPYVLFYPTCSMFYFTLSIRIAIFIRCVFMCHHVMSIRICYFIPCIIFSDCSVHPLNCRVDSTRRAKCTIRICTKSDVVIRYAPHQIPVTSDNSS
jgi:hypothetical protein